VRENETRRREEEARGAETIHRFVRIGDWLVRTVGAHVQTLGRCPSHCRAFRESFGVQRFFFGRWEEDGRRGGVSARGREGLQDGGGNGGGFQKRSREGVSESEKDYRESFCCQWFFLHSSYNLRFLLF